MTNGATRICVRCVMDTSDPEIVFDDQGVCNHCHFYEKYSAKWLLPEQEREQALKELVLRIKRSGHGHEYDCVLGVSGGVDSSYLAWKLKELGLRPLAVHFDNGWNSELAVDNIQRVLDRMEIELFTYVVDWPEFRDLQLAFLKASTPDSEIPSDHAIIATLYKIAAQHGIRHVISGNNIRTEAILPKAWSQGHDDWGYVKSVHKQFGTRQLKTYPHYGLPQMFYYYGVRRIEFVNILNLLDYQKEDALNMLKEELGWREYGGKHYESIYTRWFQGHLLPKKFGYDKRRAHLSTLINSGQATREEALTELKPPPYPDPDMEREDTLYVQKKLGLSQEEMQSIINLPPKRFDDYASYHNSRVRYPLFWTLQRLPRLRSFLDIRRTAEQ